VEIQHVSEFGYTRFQIGNLNGSLVHIALLNRVMVA
jgi:hypothetical protein